MSRGVLLQPCATCLPLGLLLPRAVQKSPCLHCSSRLCLLRWVCSSQWYPLSRGLLLPWRNPRHPSALLPRNCVLHIWPFFAALLHLGCQHSCRRAPCCPRWHLRPLEWKSHSPWRVEVSCWGRRDKVWKQLGLPLLHFHCTLRPGHHLLPNTNGLGEQLGLSLPV